MKRSDKEWNVRRKEAYLPLLGTLEDRKRRKSSTAILFGQKLGVKDMLRVSKTVMGEV